VRVPVGVSKSTTEITSDVNLPSPINANTQNNVTPFKGYIRNGNTGIDGGKSISNIKYSVYQGIDDEGVVRYVGITGRDASVRFSEHLGSNTGKSLLRYEVITSDLSKIQARIIEQTLINQFILNRKIKIT
jgi:hypothetical protein